MISSFICENCGIKVSEVEDQTCTGCGQVQSNNTEYPVDTEGLPQSEDNFKTQSQLNPFGRQGLEDAWVEEHFKNCISMFDENMPLESQIPTVLKVIDISKAKLVENPEGEPAKRLSAYLSDLLRIAEKYPESLEYGKIGILSNNSFFVHQSHTSILAAYFYLKRYEDFENHFQKALKDKYPEANYFLMKYYESQGKIDEAIDICDRIEDFSPEGRAYTKADILNKAKRYDEAESVLNKILIAGPTNANFANATNTLAFTILMPQQRFVEAEQVLVKAICTANYREKINAYSNLAMVAVGLKEFKAAKRYATKAIEHPELAISSEARLTLCRIQFAELSNDETNDTEKWKILFDLCLDALRKVHLDDAAELFKLLATATEKMQAQTKFIEVLNEVYPQLKDQNDWQTNHSVRSEIEFLRIENLSDEYLKEKKYKLLDELFLESLDDSLDFYLSGLIQYLQSGQASAAVNLKCLSIRNIQFLSEWAAFEKDPGILKELGKNENESVLVALAGNQVVTSDILLNLITKKDIDLDYAIAERVSLPLEVIEALSSSPFESVRKLLAQRSDLNIEIYRMLATDSASLVRDAIRANEYCPTEIRALAALGSL